MKKFRVNISVLIFFIVIEIFLLSFIFIPDFYGIRFNLYDSVSLLIGVVFLQFVTLSLWSIKVEINDVELIYTDYKRNKRSVLWDDIQKIDTAFYMDPSLSGYLTIVSKNDSNVPIRIPISFFKIELVKEIIKHLPVGIDVNLYTYLKRKVEGKQIWFFKEHY